MSESKGTPTVKQLRELLKNKKNSTAECVPCSRMNKAELLEHARSLGLLTREAPASAVRQPASNFLKELQAMKVMVEKDSPASAPGKKKKASLLRRLDRAIGSPASFNEAQKTDILEKLKKDLLKLRSLN